MALYFLTLICWVTALEFVILICWVMATVLVGIDRIHAVANIGRYFIDIFPTFLNPLPFTSD